MLVICLYTKVGTKKLTALCVEEDILARTCIVV